MLGDLVVFGDLVAFGDLVGLCDLVVLGDLVGLSDLALAVHTVQVIALAGLSVIVIALSISLLMIWTSQGHNYRQNWLECVFSWAILPS